MQYKYISDLHLYDLDSLAWRENITIQSYADNLLESWNYYTSVSDIVLVVGDIGYKCGKTVDVLKKLNGTKILVIGNHDLAWGKELYTCGVFNGIHQSIVSGNIFISHKPNEDRHDAQFYIHGHHHVYMTYSMLPHLRKYACDVYRYNCAADLNNQRPCTLQELMLNKEILLSQYSGYNLI